MNNVFLVTGIAGSGKSTLKEALATKGYQTYDVDSGFAQWVNRINGQVVPYSPSLAPMTMEHDWLIVESSLNQMFNSAGDSPVFLCGSAHNLYRYIDRFKQTFLLSYPSKATIEQRLTNRTNNDYGKAPGELESILGYWKSYEAEYIARGAHIINCATPLDRIVGIIEAAI